MIVDTVKCYFEAAASGDPAPVAIGAGNSSAAATSITTGTLPAGTTSDMMLVAYVFILGTNDPSTATSGWTKIGSVFSPAGSGLGVSLAVFIAQGGAGIPTFTWGLGAGCYAVAVSYQVPGGTMDGTAINGTLSSNGANGATHTSTGVTTAQSNTIVVYADVSRASGSVATPSGWTEYQDLPILGGQFATGYKQIATSGTGSGSISISAPSGEYCQIQMELKHA